MIPWFDYPEDADRGDLFDPLCIERSAPIDDQEAAAIEALCQAATPGPLVIDERAEDGGALVCALPDGRMIVSLTAPAGHTDDPGAMEADAQLICKARYLLLRLLRDRDEWKQDRECLLARIRELEAGPAPAKAVPR